MRPTALLLLGAAGAAAYPVYLECANDTATRLKAGGGAIMAGPPAACGGSCALSLATAAGSDGTTTLSITTTAPGLNFAVRVPDGAGALSSDDAALKATAACDGQMYTVGGADAPTPGTFKVVLTPTKEERGLRARLAGLAAGLRGAGRVTAAAVAGARALAEEARGFYAARTAPTFTVGYTDKFGVPLSIVTYPPAPAPPPAKLYKCVKGQCTASDTGVDIADCQQLCGGPAPPAPAQLYKCHVGQCNPSASGVDLATCQQLCTAPAPPAPTPPSPGQLYKCTAGQCAVATAGVDLATCQQLCKAPAPPGALYRCTADTCVVSDTGVDLATCQSLCKAPTPPAPPTPVNPCVHILTDIAGGVEDILKAVADCGSSAIQCTEDILASIAEFLLIIPDAARCV